MEIKSSRPASVAQVKEILTNRKSESAELGYEQGQALEHAEKFAMISAKEAKDIIEELCKNEKINEEIATKILDIRPTVPGTLRAIAAKDKIELSDEEIEKILKAVA